MSTRTKQARKVRRNKKYIKIQLQSPKNINFGSLKLARKAVELGAQPLPVALMLGKITEFLRKEQLTRTLMYNKYLKHISKVESVRMWVDVHFAARTPIAVKQAIHAWLGAFLYGDKTYKWTKLERISKRTKKISLGPWSTAPRCFNLLVSGNLILPTF